MPYNKGTQAKETMNETLSPDLLAFIAELESDLNVNLEILDFDEDEILEEIPA